MKKEFNDLIYKYFKSNFYKNKQYEENASKLALQFFNIDVEQTKLYKIGNLQDETNYKKMNYDIELYNIDGLIKIEVKTDHKSTTTGNFFIEFKQYELPSGIAITDSDFYIINDGTNYYLIETYKIKQIIKHLEDLGSIKKIKHFLYIDGELIKDSKNKPYITEGFIIPKKILIDESTLLNNN